jgi:hypothetical protein
MQGVEVVLSDVGDQLTKTAGTSLTRNRKNCGKFAPGRLDIRPPQWQLK